jgi:VIT1/CCC1 family predicted Fe2+/Mn2+ transporter
MQSAMLSQGVRRFRRMVSPWVNRSGIHPSEGHRPEGGLLREVVFGANDGLVSNVALVAGLAGGTADPSVILLGGVAGLVAGAISMSLGAYISTKSEREFRDAEERRERWEVEYMREQELAETRSIFRLKGIEEPLLDQVVEAVSRDHEQWVKLMMTEELGFPDQPPRPRVSAVIMGVAFAASAFFPVAPFLFIEGNTALASSIALTGAALFAVGALRGALTTGAKFAKGVEMVLLAAVAVAAANAIGRLVGVSV